MHGERQTVLVTNVGDNGAQRRMLRWKALLGQKRLFSADLITRAAAHPAGGGVVLDKVIMDSIRQTVAFMQYQQT